MADAQGFFGRVWQDSRRNLPTVSDGLSLVSQSLPFFESTPAPVNRSADQRPPAKGSDGQAHATPQPQAPFRLRAQLNTAHPGLVNEPGIPAFDKLRFERSQSYWARPPVAVESDTRGDALRRPQYKVASQFLGQVPQYRNDPLNQPVAQQIASHQGRATEISPDEQAPRPVKHSDEQGLPETQHPTVTQAGETPSEILSTKATLAKPRAESDARQTEQATQSAIENPTPKPAINRKVSKAEPPQPKLHIGEVRIRLVEEAKPEPSKRPSITATGSDSRRLLRSL